MKAKVRTYKYISDSFDSRFGTYYKKRDTGSEGQLNIYFDENMYIECSSNFKEEIHSICEQYIHEEIQQDIVIALENKINLLIEQYRNMKLLFIESDLFFKQKEGMIILNKENLFNEY